MIALFKQNEAGKMGEQQIRSFSEEFIGWQDPTKLTKPTPPQLSQHAKVADKSPNSYQVKTEEHSKVEPTKPKTTSDGTNLYKLEDTSNTNMNMPTASDSWQQTRTLGPTIPYIQYLPCDEYQYMPVYQYVPVYWNSNNPNMAQAQYLPSNNFGRQGPPDTAPNLNRKQQQNAAAEKAATEKAAKEAAAKKAAEEKTAKAAAAKKAAEEKAAKEAAAEKAVEEKAAKEADSKKESC
jgi:hypothetical protein